MASPCSSLDAAFVAVVGCRVSDVDFPFACLAEGIVASGASEEEVVAMGIEGLVDPAGRDPGGLHPLPFALLPGSSDYVGFSLVTHSGAENIG